MDGHQLGCIWWGLSRREGIPGQSCLITSHQRHATRDQCVCAPCPIQSPLPHSHYTESRDSSMQRGGRRKERKDEPACLNHGGKQVVYCKAIMGGERGWSAGHTRSYTTPRIMSRVYVRVPDWRTMDVTATWLTAAALLDLAP